MGWVGRGGGLCGVGCLGLVLLLLAIDYVLMIQFFPPLIGVVSEYQ